MSSDARKTYVKTLFVLLVGICRYTARWDVQIRRNIPPAGIPAYEAFRLACDVLMPFVEQEQRP